jgi:hypothetical protein
MKFTDLVSAIQPEPAPEPEHVEAVENASVEEIRKVESRPAPDRNKRVLGHDVYNRTMDFFGTANRRRQMGYPSPDDPYSEWNRARQLEREQWRRDVARMHEARDRAGERVREAEKLRIILDQRGRDDYLRAAEIGSDAWELEQLRRRNTLS